VNSCEARDSADPSRFPSQIGACRHGDRCSRKHQRPVHSQTLVAWNVYQNPANDPACTLSPAELQADFDAFYTDMFMLVRARAWSRCVSGSPR
jgi:hypothetical protein